MNGTVEAKVTCFYRRRDVPSALLKIADRAERQNEISESRISIFTVAMFSVPTSAQSVDQEGAER